MNIISLLLHYKHQAMKRAVIFILTLAITLQTFSHPWRPRHYVIVDTDGGIDDIRAISMLLASPDVRVLAITVSPGALDAATAYLKVRSFLNSCHHEGLPVGINRNSSFRSPLFQAAMNTIWGDESSVNAAAAPGFISVAGSVLRAEKTKVRFICMGGLTTASGLIDEGGIFGQQVSEIIWTSGGNDYKTGFNYKIDPESAARVLAGTIPVKLVSGFGDEVFYDEKLVMSLREIGNPYASALLKPMPDKDAAAHSFSFSAFDESAVLLLHYPGLFRKEGLVFTPFKIDACRDSLLTIVSGETVERNQVIRIFPRDPSFYFADIQPSVDAMISEHGIDEWVSGVIANELHRHLGVYAIVGVKMGIRAREYFCTGVDEFLAFSYAGSTPPLSCMNDGIQVSTGATPGHGLLSVKTSEPYSPAAEFTYLGRKIRVSLKPEYAARISSELREIAFVNSLDTDIYWELVRKNSIKYWLSMDRHEIFTVEDLAPGVFSADPGSSH